MNDVVILSPSRFSLYTICTTELLRRDNINIKGIIVRRLINPNRILSEFSRDGSRLLKKVWKKLVLKNKAYRNAKNKTIMDLMRRENIELTRVDAFKEKFGIPVIYCNSLNESKAIKAIKGLQPELVVFTGGGLIRNDVLENSGDGVLNCHIGVLPQYRGMDVVEWPILEGNFNNIGMTIHFMDVGVDTGDILKIKILKVEPGENIKELREKAEPIMCRQLVKCCIGYMDGKLKRVPQKLDEGKQYYIMHPRLLEIAENKMRKYKKD